MSRAVIIALPPESEHVPVRLAPVFARVAIPAGAIPGRAPGPTEATPAARAAIGDLIECLEMARPHLPMHHLADVEDAIVGWAQAAGVTAVAHP